MPLKRLPADLRGYSAKFWDWLGEGTDLEEIPVIDRWAIAEGFRRTVLYYLSYGAIAMGLLLILTVPDAGPSFAVLRLVPGWPTVWGALLALSGLVQLLGVIRNHRKLSALGCRASMVWYLLIATAFALTWFYWVWRRMHGHDEPNPSVYQVAVYCMVGLIHTAAVRTLDFYVRATRKNAVKGV